MNTDFRFTFENLKKCYITALKNEYKFLTCEDYCIFKHKGFNKKVIVNRVDVDMSLEKAQPLVKIFNELQIKGSFFIRLHAKEYNPFSFENYRILKMIKESGHEIGYHSEVVDESIIWKESAKKCLLRDVAMMNLMLGIKIKGVASHGGLTGYNNLDFWRDKRPKDFELLYEAYDTQPEFNLFKESFYISDSNWTSWKCYDHGNLVTDDKRSLGEHSCNNHKIIYSLIHSDTYFDKHFYE